MISTKHSSVFDKISTLLLKENLALVDCLNLVCESLKTEMEAYDWVGFYFSDFESKILHLKAFSGTPTEHTRIPFGKGICGQVALSNQNFVVPDVSQQENYIACSMDVRSELAVPLFLDQKNIGQIDIDSKTPNPFSSEDEQLLERVCHLISKTYGASLLKL